MFYIPSHSEYTLLYQGPASALKHKGPIKSLEGLKPSGHLTFTHVTGRRLADAVLELVVLLTFGARVSVRAQFTFGDAGQAGVVSPVRVEATGAVCPTATLGQETFLSKLV